MAWTWFHRLGSPPYIYALAGRLTPWFAWPAALLMLAGCTAGWCSRRRTTSRATASASSTCTRPTAWMSLMVYTTMAVAAAVGLIWRMKVAHAVAASCAPIGASFTFVALVTGSLWGGPMWGTYWEWDPRLTSELHPAVPLSRLHGVAVGDRGRAARRPRQRGAGGGGRRQRADHSLFGDLVELAAPGAVAVMRFGKPTMPPSMLMPLLMMLLGFTLLFVALLLTRLRGEVLSRERAASWIREAVSA